MGRKNLFHSTFDDWKNQNDDGSNSQLMHREGPQALAAFHGKTGYASLGEEAPDNFSKADPNSRGLGYSDLKQAYSKTLLTENSMTGLLQKRHY